MKVFEFYFLQEKKKLLPYMKKSKLMKFEFFFYEKANDVCVFAYICIFKHRKIE